ncbi:hypothetical protein TNCV_2061361 [Trichonephila clavipes]|nr:hypothetical protein TNCV_2061361 [Trichonephila clavipes]
MNGRVQTNPVCWRYRLKRQPSVPSDILLQPPASHTKAISGCQKNKSNGLRFGERGGQAKGPRSVHLPRYLAWR